MAYNLISHRMLKLINMKRTVLFFIATVLVSGVTALTVIKLTNTNSETYEYPANDFSGKKISLSDQLYPDFTYAAETSVKAVVHVKVVKKGVPQSYSIFDFFFGYGTPDEVPKNQINAGSGVIITSDGYIITNNHVIESADEIHVTLENNKTFKARLVGADPVTDVALIKVDAENLPYLTFGDSDALRLGEWVIAIGSPFNLRSTITAGIVSAKGRSMPSSSGEFKIEAFIQTDAAVNPGNSGGPLVNTKGELVGINTAIASRTGSYTGYSFAVPSLMAKKVIEDIMDFGKVQRAMLGISMQEIDGDLASEKGIKEIKGVYIAEIVRGGAADRAGMKISDQLTTINGVNVNSAPSVQEQISKFRPKDKISVELIRNGKPIALSVVLQGRNEETTQIDRESNQFSKLFGAQLEKAPEEKLKKLGINHGVEVVSVGDGKFRDTGIKPGFVITHINQIPVENINEIESIIQRSKRSLLIEGVYSKGSVVYYGMGL
ncbi:MAG: hypothetical protein ACD_77C00459G0014 [uncultured bacterium]|nr:MAG: hypothetical protein ACD_77C00459G0014 [uncultured bacterium]HBY02132.1 deoxyribonuclease HsdR [Rikenellaceae bacterium]